MALKKCPRCLLTKSTDDFRRRSHSKDGKESCCRACKHAEPPRPTPPLEKKREYQKRWLAKRPPGHKARLNRVSYERNRKNVIAKVREWESKNYRKARNYGKQSLARRRGLMAAGGVTLEQWNEVIEYFDSRCAYCLRKLDEPTQEHVIPFACGGKHSPDNVVPCCLHCNVTRGKRPLWFMLNGLRS